MTHAHVAQVSNTKSAAANNMTEITERGDLYCYSMTNTELNFRIWKTV